MIILKVTNKTGFRSLSEKYIFGKATGRFKLTPQPFWFGKFLHTLISYMQLESNFPWPKLLSGCLIEDHPFSTYVEFSE